jgi:hypothetical protein
MQKLPRSWSLRTVATQQSNTQHPHGHLKRSTFSLIARVAAGTAVAEPSC